MAAPKALRLSGHWIATQRRRLGMTQADLAHATGKHPNTIARYERGELRAPLLLLQFLNDRTGDTRSNG